MDELPQQEKCTNCKLIIVVFVNAVSLYRNALPAKDLYQVTRLTLYPVSVKHVIEKNCKKLQKTRHAFDNIVAEVNMPTDDTDTTYERLITRNALDILEVIDEHIKMKR